MKISVPMMVDDPLTQRKKTPAEEVRLEEEFFLDGPVSRRVAIVDFEKDGSLAYGARLLRAPQGKVGSYVIPRRNNVYSRAFIQVSVFATVLKTMALFEEKDVLGRKLTWGFDGPQLLVVPRAGESENAFYDRDSRSLQFFYFRSRGGSRGQVYTALSRDIVSHETGHAILDGVAPDLYDAVTPQSLALHEAVADLTALLSAFASRTLRKQVLAETGGRIDQPSAFSAIASQFQAGRTGSDTAVVDFANHALRNLMNERKLDPLQTEPHALSEVLSGALYRLMLTIYDDVKSAKAVEGKLGIAALRFRRIVFRALDYLPPGEVSFADYARAILASDEASFPDSDRYRRAIIGEFVARGIAAAESDLAVETNFTNRALDSVDLATLVHSDWVAYEFANRNRKLLKIPDDGRPFRVRPRLDVTKTYNRGVEKFEDVRECIFKVSWETEERNRLKGLPDTRQVTVGTTMAIDWKTKTIRALLTSEYRLQRNARDAMLRALDGQGMLLPMTELLGPGGKPLRHAIGYESANGVMRVRGVANLLHITAAAL
jgi:hypothetical protein